MLYLSIKIRCIFFLFAIQFLFPTIGLLAENQYQIDLTKNCVNGNCTPNKWYAIDSFDPSYLQILFPDNQWKEINQFPIWMNKLFPKDEKLATYTLMTYFDIPDEILYHPDQHGIRFAEIGEVFEIYLNGTLIVKEGELENGKVSFHRTIRGKVWEVPKDCIQAKRNHLVIKISGHPKFDHTGLYLTKKYDFGLFEDLRYDEQDRVSLALLTVYLIVGFYHLFLFYKRRVEGYNFYYGAFALIVGIYVYTRSSAIFEHNWDTSIIQRIELMILYPGMLFLIESLERLFFNSTRKWTKGYRYFSYLLCIITLLCPEMYQAEYVLRVWQISAMTFAIPLMGIIFYQAIRQHIRNARRLLGGLIFFLLAAIYDIVDSLIFNSGLSFSKYAFFMYILGFAVVLADKFIMVHNEVEELNASLEKKVEERTRELQKTLTQVQNLKQQQDGDYFLTTLLIKPLMVNEARSNKVKIEFFIKQKKTFEFKNKTYEIGGDMCIANNIKLRGKEYCVFINGDAMGKSIQGAGGALVLGVVFRSIIERTKIFKPNMELFPEQWIKICFIELQNIFASFDGSMLISIVMGLVEESTGALFFLNAEHPWTVLYRDEKANFLEQELYLHKVGMLGLNGSLKVQTFQMQSGDSIIIGSDGRDDIMLGMNGDGRRNINEDGYQFLQHVEVGKGELKGITDSILKKGEFTDDYTLIKVQYIEEYKQMEEEVDSEFNFLVDKGDLLLDKRNQSLAIEYYLKALRIKKDKNIYLKLVDIYYSNKDYKEFIPLCEEYLSNYPMDSEYYFKISYAYKFEGNFSLAIDYGECLKLREPRNINNLLNLSDLNRKTGNIARANKLLTDVMFLEPDNLKAQELQRMIDGQLRRSE